jgi:hypothetical protein
VWFRQSGQQYSRTPSLPAGAHQRGRDGCAGQHGWFTNEVKINTEQQRRQPVLLLSGKELHELEAGYRVSLPALLYRKRESLVRDAVVLLDDRWTRAMSRVGQLDVSKGRSCHTVFPIVIAM